MSTTIIGNYIQIISHVLTFLGFRRISPEEGIALELVVGLIGEVVGFVMTQYGRLRHGDLNIFGFRKAIN